MSRKLRNNQLDTEELLKLVDYGVQSQLTPDLIDNLKYDVSLFLSIFNILPGDYQIEKKTLYKIYKKWSHDQVNIHRFNYQANKYITHNNKYFFVNLKALEIELKTIELLESDGNKKKKSKLKNKNYKTHFEAFLNKNEIKPGQYWIDSYLLYYLYDKWTYEYKKNHSLSIGLFNSFCELYFEHVKTNNSVDRFRVDISILQHLPIEKQNAIRIAREERSGKKEKGKRKGRKTKAEKDEEIKQTLSSVESICESKDPIGSN